MKHLAPFMLALFASVAFAGDCHIPHVVPFVNAWNIAGSPGGLVVDAKIAARGSPPSSNYDDPNSDDGWWWHDLYLRPEGETGFYKQVDCHDATVTDSTFHFEVAHPAGAYEYIADVGGRGNNGDPDECSWVYEWTGTVVIEAPTPAKRVSLGAVKARWAP